MLHLLILGIVLVVEGVILYIVSVRYASECNIKGYVAFVVGIGIICIASSIVMVDNEWKLQEEVYLEPVLGKAYFIEESSYFLYKEATSNQESPEIIFKYEEPIVEKERISEEETPYLVKYKKVRWLDTKKRYVFHLPENHFPEEKKE